MNNLSGLKSINLGYLDEKTFNSFLNDYKSNAKKLENLTCLKISLGTSVVYYNKLEKQIFEYININSPKLEEKFLFSDLKIPSEEKMNALIELVYFKSVIPKLLIQIGNDDNNIRILTKAIQSHIKERQTQMNTLILIMDIPEYKRLYVPNIIECLASFYAKKRDKAILCKENPNNSYY